jgi:hypothetical protein
VGGKVDNDNFGAKLTLRRHFLRRYHVTPDGQPTRVFDACQATGQLWKALRGEFGVQYFGVDLTPQKGRLKIDSTRVLATPGWSFDVVDVDTYGSPWAQWEQVLRHGRAPVTVFLTIGSTMFSGSTDNVALRALGLGPVLHLIPPSLRRRFDELGVQYCLALCHRYGWRVVEALEAPRGRSARYLGVHLRPLSIH